MGPQRFVQVAMPGQDLLLAEVTRHRGNAELLIESVVRPPEEPAFRVRVLLTDVDAAEAAGLVRRIAQRYGTTPRVEAGRLSFDVRPTELPPGMFDVLLAFQASFGPVWMHVSRGRLTLRAQAVDCTPEECAMQLRTALRLAGIRRQVRVIDVADEDLRAWGRLLAWRAEEEPLPAARVP